MTQDFTHQWQVYAPDTKKLAAAAAASPVARWPSTRATANGHVAVANLLRAAL
jgi:hypothetical protein